MSKTKPSRSLKIEDVPQEFSAAGEPLCRMCKSVVQAPRRTFCSEPCVEEYYIRANPSYARNKVLERDRGVCSDCGLDTEKLKSYLYQIKTKKGDLLYNQLLIFYKENYGFDFDLQKHYWEADHIRPVAEGGGSCGLDNLQTLCRICHRDKTKRQFRRARKVKAIQRFQKYHRNKHPLKESAFEEHYEEVESTSDFE